MATLFRISRKSHLSSYDKGENEMRPMAVHRSPGIYFTVEENPVNFNWEKSDEDYATSHRLKWDPSLSNDVGRIAENIKAGEGKNKETMGTGYERIYLFL